MNVPVGLFTPVVRIDFGGAIENSNPPIVRDRWYQIDGGPWTKDNQFLLSGVLNQIVTTVRVFVVSGHAPDVVEDWNGDGKVDAQDLLAHGYTLLSQEVVFQFRTYHQEEEYGIGVAYDYIPDGMVPPVLPAGGGGVNPVPR